MHCVKRSQLILLIPLWRVVNNKLHQIFALSSSNHQSFHVAFAIPCNYLRTESEPISVILEIRNANPVFFEPWDIGSVRSGIQTEAATKWPSAEGGFVGKG